jgi:hypothetical protein
MEGRMFADSLALEIDSAHPKHLDYLARQLWQAHAAGQLDDAAAQGLAEALRARQRGPMPSIRAGGNNAPAGKCELRRRPPRSPDRQRSMERRRRLSAAGLMPPALALKFTVGERAVLYVVATEVRRRKQCDLYIDQLAAFAGVGRTTCRNALRQAKRLGLIQIDERRLSARYNDANRITIIDRAWLAWLAHGRKETVKKPVPACNQHSNPGKFSRVEPPQAADRGRQGGHAARADLNSPRW